MRTVSGLYVDPEGPGAEERVFNLYGSSWQRRCCGNSTPGLLPAGSLFSTYSSVAYPSMPPPPPVFSDALVSALPENAHAITAVVSEVCGSPDSNLFGACVMDTICTGSAAVGVASITTATSIAASQSALVMPPQFFLPTTEVLFRSTLDPINTTFAAALVDNSVQLLYTLITGPPGATFCGGVGVLCIPAFSRSTLGQQVIQNASWNVFIEVRNLCKCSSLTVGIRHA